MRDALGFAVALLIVLSGSACRYIDRSKQVRTSADMQTIVAKLEGLRDQGDLGDPAKVRGIVMSVARGRDAWGTDLIYFSKATNHGLSYVLVSLGSDRKADLRDLEEYFTLHERVIHAEPWKDIVFRDGVPVTRAGK